MRKPSKKTKKKVQQAVKKLTNVNKQQQNIKAVNS